MILEQTAAFVAGLVSMIYGTFSGGAAMVIVPALVLLGLTPAAAVATNRMANFVSAIARVPFLKGTLNLGNKIPAVLILFHSIGSVLGGLILLSLSPDLLFSIMGVLLVIGGIISLLSKKGTIAAKKTDITMKALAIASVLLFIIGIYRGFFGPASGTFGRIVSVHVLGLDFTQALALATYYSLFSSFFTFIIFLYAGIINFELGIPLAIGAAFGAAWGTKFAVGKGNDFMKICFSALAVIFGGYFIFFR